MKKIIKKIEEFEIKISSTEYVYELNVVSKMVGLAPWKIRTLIREGIIAPKVVGKKKKLFSLKDIKKLEYVKYLMEEKGVNIKGVKIILEIERT